MSTYSCVTTKIWFCNTNNLNHLLLDTLQNNVFIFYFFLEFLCLHFVNSSKSVLQMAKLNNINIYKFYYKKYFTHIKTSTKGKNGISTDHA